MGKCSKCGKSGLFLKTKKCIVCSNPCCEKCLHHKLELSAHEQEASLKKDVWFCSEDCVDEFTQRLINSYLDSPYDQAPVSLVAALNPKLFEELAKPFKDPSFTVKGAEDISDKLFQAQMLNNAQTLEKAGRLSDAARIYESLRMSDKARQLREEESKHAHTQKDN
jgi:hypothetical protein